ncbi:type I inositol polyphosphate 5-phosphatase 12-like [Asparagus officinalis]|uniref:type I inositol polyphosphate 5-phosphatase 12-like n=1 Tax=Asparagus officinalis TaxID=4686 RepID=UPI00098DF61A|nr:type I inositol polyphosphate 5-phosphatase 12-like [Asparagus officinalis]
MTYWTLSVLRSQALNFSRENVQPAVGVVNPGKSIEVSVHHEENSTQEAFVDGIISSRRCEDIMEKEAVLLVNVMGNYSTKRITHRVNVHCCYSDRLSSGEKGISKRVQSNHLGADFAADLESNTDLVQDSCTNP